MISGREPTVVKGPEVLSKYVGEAEGNIRKLFEPAEKVSCVLCFVSYLIVL